MVAFVFFSAILLIVLQVVISFRIKGKTVRGHDNLEQTADLNANLVFLGSSRCWSHFDPVFFDSVFHLKCVNIGVDGHSEISMAIIRLNDYLSRNKTPEYAIMSFDPFINPGSQTNNRNFVHKDDFARYAFLPNKKDQPIVNYFRFSFGEKYIPLYAIFKYKMLKDCITLKNTDNYMQYGYERHDENWDTIASPVTDSTKKFYFDDSDIGDISKALGTLNRLCMKNHIKLICLQTPVYSSCYNELKFSTTRMICESNHIPFIDVNKEEIRNNIGFFYNSNHLNTKGIAKMNSLLRNDPQLNAFLKN